MTSFIRNQIKEIVIYIVWGEVGQVFVVYYYYFIYNYFKYETCYVALYIIKV